jgi:cytochrome c oxidase subunit 3
VKRRVVDVSKLSDIGFSHRDPLWWAVLLLIAIEGTMLGLLTVAYFYVGERTDPFPPVHMSTKLAWIATLDVALWLVSAWPQRRASKAAIAGSVTGMRNNLMLASIFTLLAVAVRVWLMMSLPFHWDDHAYGSVVWGLLAVHFSHGVTAAGEDLAYVALLFIGPVEDKHRVDVEVSAPLVYFVVAGGLLIWAVVFLRIFLGGGG